MRHRHTTQNKTPIVQIWKERVHKHEHIRILPNMWNKTKQSSENKNSKTHQPTRLKLYLVGPIRLDDKSRQGVIPAEIFK
jgi:hypothetical protein